MGDFPPYDEDDENDGYDGLSALDYGYPAEDSDDDSGLSALDAVSGPVPDAADEIDSGLDAFHEPEDDEEPAVPVFTVTNPPGTVTVTTYLDGRVQHIELSPKAVNMSEAELADEILVIADLAAQDARSAQYAVMLEGMRTHGHDDVDTREFLNRELKLPSPEQADSARAQVFATRYGVNNG